MTDTDDTHVPPPPVHAVERITEGVPEGTVVIALSGELDLAASPDFRRALEEGRDQAPQRVVLDLTEAAFVDSTMLKELLRANAETAENGGTLVLVGPQPPVQRLLDLTRTATLFTIRADRASAWD